MDIVWEMLHAEYQNIVHIKDKKTAHALMELGLIVHIMRYGEPVIDGRYRVPRKIAFVSIEQKI